MPLYFAVVGLRLDLVGAFEPLFFLFLLGFACLVKSVSCYAGARLVGEGRAGAGNLAVALNARGGPGIVLASVALDAGIIEDAFYTMLIMLALVTSVIAGSWLDAALRRGGALLTDPEPQEPKGSARESGQPIPAQSPTVAKLPVSADVSPGPWRTPGSRGTMAVERHLPGEGGRLMGTGEW